MKREEAIKIITDLIKNKSLDLNDTDKKAMSMAVASLDAWGKVKKEISQQSKMSGQSIYSLAMKSISNDIIDKYLKEVS